ncbi:hypothetical protein LOTGIDRAFT_217236 [Lottia gigantea]|uniref:Protein HTATIP2 n=1 Tax=Lottia gigantea TaxID=225164 RepID=V4A9I5_LOTGI|nr:hypothetical protein LOTGIDRAFT_217236 [Lottia gigantea]ESO91740.1 hypothetical protein LOTGIDRAFT_217236 [Lottia gigantea]
MASNYEDNVAEFKERKHKAFVVGYTGESGKELVKQIQAADIFEKVVLIGRREVPPENISGVDYEQKVVDFDNLEQHAEVFNDCDIGFCCLGTTKAKSGAAGFLKVDYDYILSVGQIAKSKGCKHFSLVSSQGADKESSMFYLKTKGQVEEALKNHQFQRLSVYRPGVLMCNRQESRPGEAIARLFLKPVAALFPTAITTPVETLAKAMINNVMMKSEKTYEIYENKAIHELAKVGKDKGGCK